MSTGGQFEPGTVPDAGYPSPSVETIYADGVTSLQPGNQTIRFYLTRLEPNFIASQPSKPVVVGQIVMPVGGFVHSLVFFNKVLENMVRDGRVTQEFIDEIKKNSAPV
jgi:hypothetical protein